MEIDDLISPAVLVEEKRLSANIRRMQNKADAQGVRLRPHVKTHKSAALARRQREAGAVGITVATVHEAEVFAEAGFSDIRIAYSLVGSEKYRRLLGLREQADISFCVDTEEGIRQASSFFDARDAAVDVLLEIDTGQGRCGGEWNSEYVVTLARHVDEAPGLQLRGILTHAGQVYAGPENGERAADALERVAAAERDRMLSVAGRLQEAGIVSGGSQENFEITIGSTPTMAGFENAEADGFSITEVRPGNYVFHDAMQVALGSAALSDCALTVLGTVTSKHREGTRDRVIIDAGKKVFTTDTGYGTTGYGMVLYNAGAMRAHPHAVLAKLSEEHGYVYVPGGSTLHVGDRVRIVPNHACVTAGAQNRLYLVDGDEVLEEVVVDARGY